jgi:hypothetical protein
MEIKRAVIAIQLAAWITCPGLRAFQDQIYYGEVTAQTADAVTLNVEPCEKDPKLQTVSPYKKIGEEAATCRTGKKYTKIAVQAISTSGGSDKPGDKNKQPPPPPAGSNDKKSDKKSGQ